MTISETDLKLLKAERMTDFSDGGGKMTGNEVVDGQVNNLFNDISQLDRTYGRVSLRKSYAVVQTANTDTYLGAHIILTDPPDDPSVNVTLFTTQDWTDDRNAARDRIESYSIQGPESQWILYGDHVVGQKMLMLFSRTNATNLSTPTADATPEIGDVMMLSVEKAGFTANWQYVRITKIISRETQQFTDGAGNFYKDVAVLEISNALRYLFNGATPSRYTLSRNDINSSPTVFRRSSVADAAEYYGVKKITQPLAINDLTIDVGSPYSALVPSATAETPLVDMPANMARANLVQSGAVASLTASASLSADTSPDYASALYLGRGFLPGSLLLSIAGAGYKDDSNSNIILAGGGAGTYAGTVDYASGKINITKTASWSASVTAAATPAVAVYDSAGTAEIPITINNRAFNFVQSLLPIPSPGSLVVDYKALDKWYRLSDDGLGHLNGAVSGIGTGTVNYATGSVLVTLAAMPDVGSSVIFGWTTPLDYTMQTYVLQQPKPAIKVTLINTPVVPASLTITWMDEVLKTATSVADGTLSGDATGRLVAANGELEFFPVNVPTSGTVFSLDYQQSTTVQDVFSVTGDANGAVIFALTQTPIKPGSIKLAFTVTKPQTVGYYLDGNQVFGSDSGSTAIAITDDGGGAFLNGYSGTIDYATGAVTLDTTLLHVINRAVSIDSVSGARGGGSSESKVIIAPISESDTLPDNTTLTAQYALDSATPIAKNESINLTELRVDLSTTTAEALIAGGIQFGFAGSIFIDRQGILYRDHDVTTDSATASGSIDYQTGIATLTQWTGGNGTLAINAAVSIKGQSYVVGVVGRAPGAPLATGQFQISCTAANGDLITASADNNGDLISDWCTGHVDWQTSIYALFFGKRLLDTAIPADVKANSGWYDVANVGGDGLIWSPRLVKPETIFFNAVLISFIPLNADILGVDTVRLPQDGRVPLYRVGNVAVIHNTQTLTLPNPVTAGSTHNSGRTLLSYAKVFDADGLVVPTAKYTADLDAGTVTLANPLDLTGYVQPLSIEHRIEDMALVTDVQITGQIKLMKPVRHAYPANTSFLSSALVIGDLQARVTGLFDQQTWANVFSDSLSGSVASASFNDVLYPLLVTNAGAIQERWALVFTGATAFNCYGEYSGLVATGATGADFSPINPFTSVPYFSIPAGGFGTGWSAGNVLRFNTIAANFPLWLARTTLQSDPSVYTDNFKLQIRGDAN